MARGRGRGPGRPPRPGGASRGDAGDVTVEFALIGTFFFLLVGLAIQGAILFNAWLVISNAVEEGARFGAPCYGRALSPCTAADVAATVGQAATVDPAQLTVTVSAASGLLTVAASYNVPLVAPFAASFLPNPTRLVAASSMRLENGGS